MAMMMDGQRLRLHRAVAAHAPLLDVSRPCSWSQSLAGAPPIHYRVPSVCPMLF
ncbi:hypothetical protein M8494_10595 [Serratia ureilytica]